MKKTILGLLLTLVTAGCGAVPAFSAAQTQCVSNALAGGTVDAIRIPLQPCALSTTILILTLAGANTSQTPTLQMAGYPAQPIYTSNGGELYAGQLPGAGSVVMLTGTGTSWLLMSSSPVPEVEFGDFVFTNVTCTLYTAFTNPCLRTASTLGGQIPYFLDQYGHVLVGNVFGTYSNLKCEPGVSASLCNDVGPAIRVLGDILFGDSVYFGATSTAGTQVLQMGVRAWGAFASKTVIQSGWTNYSVDTAPAGNCTGSSTACGSGYIIIHPDDTNQTTLQGSIEINAYGNGAGNQVIFGRRSAANTTSTTWTIGTSGGIFSAGNTGGDLGANTLNVGATLRVGSASAARMELFGSATEAAISTNAGFLRLQSFTGITQIYNGSNALLEMTASGLGTNLKNWGASHAGNLLFAAYNDAMSDLTEAYQIARGTTFNVASHTWYTSTVASTPNVGMTLDTTGLTITGLLTLSGGTLLATSANLTNGAAAQTATFTNSPCAGNPTKWVPINDNGTTRYLALISC